ncbi:glycosyltransferase [Azospirillum sp. TSH64]|uniref:glycosyltransferase n=1 Tax=Azospirillum sp. TSH64 TaxID=652740 RepID=UPI000D686E85|nr:glycosyltransferase [Azospirillum sp. TSH64]
MQSVHAVQSEAEIWSQLDVFRNTGDAAPAHEAITRLLGENETRLAERLCKALLADSPEDVVALDALSQIAERAGDIPETIRWIERLIATPKPPAFAFTRCMYLYRSLGDSDKALRTIFHGRAHHPNSEDLRLQTLSLLIERGALNWARAEAELVLLLGITMPPLVRLVTHALIEGGAPNHVLAAAASVVQGVSDPAGALCGYRLLIKAELPKEAAAVLIAGLAAFPGNVELVKDALDAVRRDPQLLAPFGLSGMDGAESLSLSGSMTDVGTLGDALALVMVDPAQPATTPDVKVLEQIVRNSPLAVPRPDGPIVFVSWTLARGGAERLVAMAFKRLRARLAPRPVELLLFDCSDERGSSFYLREAGLTRADVIVQPELQNIDVPYAWLQMPNAQQWLINHFRNRKPSVVYAHLEVPNLLAGLAGVLTGVPRLLIGTYNMKPPDFIDDEDACHWYREGYRQLLTRPEVHLTGLAQTCIDDYQEWLGVDLSTRSSVIPSGFDMSGFRSALDPDDRERARRILGIAGDTPVVGVMMRIVPPKDPLLWVKVASAVHRNRTDTRFVVIGDGPLAQAMKDAVEEAGLTPAFLFPGVVADAYSVLPAFDVFLMTSHSEGVPNVVIEAQASGLPVVARRAGAVADAMLPEQSGVVLDTAHPDQLAAAVLTFLNDSILARKAGAVAQAFARQNFDIERMIDEIAALMDT